MAPGSSDDAALRRFHSLVNQSETLVYVLDVETAAVVDVSLGAARAADLDPSVIVGRHVRQLRVSYPMQTDEQWRELVAAASAPGGVELDLELGRLGGGLFPARVRITAAEFDGRRYLLAIGRALDGPERRYADLERQNAWQRAMLQLAIDPAVTTGDLDKACPLIARAAADAMPCSAAAMWLRDENRPGVLHACGVAGDTKLTRGTRFDLRRYPQLLALLNAGRSCDLIDEIPAVDPLAAIGVHACLAAPIRVTGTVCGAITLFHHQRRKWSAADHSFAGMVADQAAVAALNGQYQHAQRAARESADRYRNFVENSTEAIWRIEFATPVPLDLPAGEQVDRMLSCGVVAECNDALVRLGGFASVADLQGRTLTECLAITDPRPRESLLQLANHGFRIENQEVWHADRHGREYWLRRSVQPTVRDGCIVRLWGFSRDVTRSKRATDLLEILARTQPGPGAFLTMTKRLARSLGAEDALIASLDPVSGAVRVLARAAEGSPEDLPPWLSAQDSPGIVQRPLVDSSGARIGMICVRFEPRTAPHDLAGFALDAFAARASAELESARSRQQLEESHERYRSFVEFSSESIWRVDLAEPLSVALPENEHVEHIRRHGFIAECNQATADYLGLESPEKLQGLPLAQFFPADSAERTAQLHEIVRAGFRLAGQEAWQTGPDGERRCFLRSLVGIRKGGYLVRLWGVSREVTEQKAMERQIRALSARRQEVLEEERARISREIHDDLGQRLSALRLHIAGTLTRGGGEMAALGEALSLIDGAIASTRQIASGLRPPVLDHFGLAAAIEDHVKEFERATGLLCDCDVQEGLELPRGQALAIFRILQESLTNIVRHSGATEAMITLIEEEDELVLCVSDNGNGLRPQQGRPAGGLGLVGMRERASAYGGELHVTSMHGRGTVVEARFPLPRRKERTA